MRPEASARTAKKHLPRSADRRRRGGPATAQPLERRTLMSTSVTVTVYQDANQLGTSTTPVVGREVYADLAGAGVLEAGDPTAVTGSNGTATLSLAGATGSTVGVGEVLPDGVGQTYPVTDEATVTVASPAAVGFGNLTLSPSGTTTNANDYTDYAFAGLPSGATVTNAVTQPDGKLVLIGNDTGGSFVARYFYDGVADLHFSGNGNVTNAGHIGNGTTGVDVVVEPNGDIAALTVDSSTSVPYVTLLTPAGAYVAETQIAQQGSPSLNLMADGSLLVTALGYTLEDSTYDAVAYDLSPTTLAVNTGFADDIGYSDYPVAASVTVPTDLASVVNASGGFDMVVSVGSGTTDVATFDSSGGYVTQQQVDISGAVEAQATAADGGTDPYAAATDGPTFQVQALAAQPDGDIVIAGTALEPTEDQQNGVQDALVSVVARVSAAGVLDGSFGTGGVVSTDDGATSNYSGSEAASAAEVLSNGWIVVTDSATYTNQDGTTGVITTTYECVCRVFGNTGSAVVAYAAGGNQLTVASGTSGDGGAPLAPLSGVLPAVTEPDDVVAGEATPDVAATGVGFVGAAPVAMLTGNGAADLVVDTTPPTAALTATPATVTAAGSTTPEVLRVTYTDTISLRVRSLGTGDLTVAVPAGAGGGTATATYLGVEAGGDALSLIADYAVPPVGGAWTYADNGPYTINLAADQVRNANTYAAAAQLGTFTVTVPSTTPPTANLATVPTITTAGTAPITLSVTYTGSAAAINAGTIDVNDLTVSGSAGTLTVTAATPGTASGDGLPVTYTVAAPAGGFTAGTTRSYTVSLVAGQVSDDAGNAAVAATLGTISVNIPATVTPTATPPTAVLSAVPTIATAGTMSVSLVVTYTGHSAAIAAGTIGTADLTVARGSVQLTVTAATAGTASGDVLPVTYTVAAPAGGFKSANDGPYTVSLVAGQVTDTAGTAAAAATLGTFSVAIPTTPPTARLAAVTPVTTAGVTPVTLTVTYTGSAASIATTSIAVGNLTVTGPAGTLTIALATAGTASGKALPVTYTVSAPSGGWTTADDGTYAVALVAGQVSDAAGNAAAAAALGSFAVALGAPVGMLAARSPITVAATTSVSLAITYTGTAAAINAGTVAVGNLTVTGPSGATLTISSATAGSASGLSLPVVYTVAAPTGGFTAADDGTYTVATVANQVKDSAGTAAPATVLGTFAVDIATTPPTAVLAAVPAVTTAGTATVSLTVSYTGASVAIDATTIGVGDLNVTGSDGSTPSVTSATAGTASGDTLPVTYTVAAPGNGFAAGTDVTYTVALAAGTVADVTGTTALAATLGTFTVDIAGSVTPIVTVGNLSSTVTVVASPATVDTGNLVQLTATVTPVVAGAAPTGTVTFTDAAGDVLGTAAVGSGGTATIGVDPTIAETLSVTASYGGDSNYAPAASAAPASLTAVAPLAGSPTLTPGLGRAVIPSNLVFGDGRHVSVPVIIRNGGGAIEKGVVTVRLYESADGALDGAAKQLLPATSYKVSIRPGASKTVSIVLKGQLSDTSAGTFHLLAQVVDAAGFAQTAATATAFTVAPAVITPTLAFGRLTGPSVVLGGTTVRNAATLSLTNGGNVALAGPVTVALYLTTDGTVAGSVAALTPVAVKVNIKPGKTGRLSVRLGTVPTVAAGLYQLLAVVTTPAVNGAAAATASAVDAAVSVE
jgi:hypothetical protein